MDLVVGEHYGAFVCDLKLMKVFVFDSISGDYENGSNVLGTHDIFILLVAKTIFDKNKRVKDATINKLQNSIKLHGSIKTIFKTKIDKSKNQHFMVWYWC